MALGRTPVSGHITLSTLTGDCQKDRVKVTFGLIPKKKDHYGMMMYHKNRLIKAYEKVGCQLKVKEQDTIVHNIKITTGVGPPPRRPVSPCLAGFRLEGRSRRHRCH